MLLFAKRTVYDLVFGMKAFFDFVSKALFGDVFFRFKYVKSVALKLPITLREFRITSRDLSHCQQAFAFGSGHSTPNFAYSTRR